MSEAIINATGLACPQPVMLAKKALDEHDDVVVLVDNTTALENVKRLAFNTGCSAQITENTGGFFKMHMKKQNGKSPSNQPTVSSCCNTGTQPASTDPSVFVIASDAMGRGRGKDELGAILMKAFIHTTTDLESKPDVMIFYNAGVKLVSEGSDALDDLKQLEEKGIKMLVCGTCVNYFNLTGKIAAGVISNMYDIADTLSRVRRIVRPWQNLPIEYLVTLFDSISHVIRAERILKEATVPHKIIPVPRKISSSCWVCIRFLPEHGELLDNTLMGKVETYIVQQL